MDKKQNMIDSWLAEHGDQEINQFIDKNLDIVDKVHTVLKERNLSKADFAKLLEKKPSEVSRWLSGMHNLTLKSIIKMEQALGIDLIYTKPQIKHAYHYIEVPGEADLVSEKNVKYESTAEENKSTFELIF